MLHSEHASDSSISAIPELSEAETLENDLRKLLVRSENELIKGDAREHVEKLERWIESYRRGLSAAQKISDNGMDILKKARDQLALSLEEMLRLEDDGGNSANKEQAAQIEQMTSAVRRIDRLIPVIEQSFQCAPKELEHS